MLPIILLTVVAAINDALYYDTQLFAFITDPNFINGDLLIMLGTPNPIYMIYDVIGNTIGYNIEDVSVKGMISIANTLPHITEKNLLLKAWTPISMVEMILMSLGLLRLSAVLLNPIKGKQKPINNRKKNNKQPVKKVENGVQT